MVYNTKYGPIHISAKIKEQYEEMAQLPLKRCYIESAIIDTPTS